MTSSPHRIRRQQWLVSTSSADHAFKFRKQIRERWEDILLPVFEKAFDEILVEDNILHIPRLEVKLKVGNNSELWENLPKELYEQLNLQLQPFATKKTEYFGDSGSWSEILEPQHNFEVLIHYLKQGNLPWDLSILSARESSLKLKETIQNQWPQLLDYIQGHNFSQSSFFRLFQLISVEQSIEIVNKLTGNLTHLLYDDLKKILVALLKTGDTISNKYARLTLAAKFLASDFMEEDPNVVSDLMTMANKILTREEIAYFQQFISSMPNNASLIRYKEGEHVPYVTGIKIKENELPPDIMPTVIENEQLPDYTTIESKTAQSPGVRVVEGEEEPSSAGKAINDKPEFPEHYSDVSESMDLSRQMPLNNLQNTVRIKVQYAGLVLLHPFLHRFFVQTAILEDRQQDISFLNLPRAAALLHFLVTGTDEVYEFELGFIKLLLGMDPEQSLPVSEGLVTQPDKMEAEALLHSVIGHWSILKSTSIDGLRTSFLQRNALVHQTEEGWMVQMESTPFDMLINHLPWSFAIIKLPWMQKPIFTEWQTL